MLFSTDYMHLAEAGKLSKTITLPPVSMGENDTTANGFVDVPLASPDGSIARTIVQYQGTNMDKPNYVLSNGSFRVEEMYDDVFYWEIFWNRINDQHIRVNYYIIRLATGWPVNVPSLTFTLIQQYLKAPN
jgi:hypothetical protein